MATSFRAEDERHHDFTSHFRLVDEVFQVVPFVFVAGVEQNLQGMLQVFACPGQIWRLATFGRFV